MSTRLSRRSWRELRSFGCGRSLASFWWDEEGPLSLEAPALCCARERMHRRCFLFVAADSESREDSEDEMWEN